MRNDPTRNPVPGGTNDPAYVGGYWDIIETALTALPDDSPYRAQALRAFDHLKSRVLVRAALASPEART